MVICQFSLASPLSHVHVCLLSCLLACAFCLFCLFVCFFGPSLVSLLCFVSSVFLWLLLGLIVLFCPLSLVLVVLSWSLHSGPPPRLEKHDFFVGWFLFVSLFFSWSVLGLSDKNRSMPWLLGLDFPSHVPLISDSFQQSSLFLGRFPFNFKLRKAKSVLSVVQTSFSLFGCLHILLKNPSMRCCFEFQHPFAYPKQKEGLGVPNPPHVQESINVPVSLSCVSFYFPFGVHLRLFWGSEVP